MIATRRTPSTKPVRSATGRPAGGHRARRGGAARSGITRWFEIMIATATEFDDHHRGRGREAAEEGERARCRRRRRGAAAPSTVMSRSISPLPKDRKAAERDRDDEKVDQDEVEREQPGGALDVLDRRGSRPRPCGTGAAAGARRSAESRMSVAKLTGLRGAERDREVEIAALGEARPSIPSRPPNITEGDVRCRRRGRRRA